MGQYYCLQKSHKVGEKMSNIRLNKGIMEKAEAQRYSKIQNIIDYLQGNRNSGLIDILMGDSVPSSFNVGRRISVDGKVIKIGKKNYNTYEIKKVSINTEGSMAIYKNNGKKLCGSLSLNVSMENIGVFCAWVRQNAIPVEVVSGKGERAFQYTFLVIVILVILIIKFL